jgi:hypothetical protein
MIASGASAGAISRNERVEYVAELRRQEKITVFIDHKRNHTVALIHDGGVELRSHITLFPTETIVTQLKLVFG